MTWFHPGVLSLPEHRSPVRLFRVGVLGADGIWFATVVVDRGIRRDSVDHRGRLLRAQLLEVLLVFIVVSLGISGGVVHSFRGRLSQGLVDHSRPGHL